MRLVASLVLVLISTGCHADGCLLEIIGIAHQDCNMAPNAFPQDDASCRSYGLRPGTHDYAVCRKAKAHMEKLTQDETGYSFLRNPLLPDVR
ncbi:MAG: hypothetical protein ABSA13_17280 [Beijerinckiaceae bacterium]|jgi:hypothetical protein